MNEQFLFFDVKNAFELLYLYKYINYLIFLIFVKTIN